MSRIDVGSLRVLLHETQEIHRRIEAVYGALDDNGAHWATLAAAAKAEAELQSLVSALHTDLQAGAA